VSCQLTKILKFGGNPDHVTLGGASAGAASVVLQLTAYGGRDDNLFHAAASESQAFPPIRNVTDMQWTYDALLKLTGCEDLICLKQLDAVTFQNAVRNFKPAFPGGKSAPLFFWNPTLDYDFIQDYTYNEVNSGHFVKVPTIFGDTTNEGLGFTPTKINSVQSALQFVVNQFPNLAQDDFARLRDAWPGPMDFRHDREWRNVASDIYGHIRYICPGLNISHAYAEDGTAPTWQYRWNVGKALHVDELGPVWNNGTTPARVYMQSYIASFIRSYDPNKHVAEYLLPSGNALSSPLWTTFGAGNGQRLLFADENDVNMEDVSQEEREKCDVITEMGIQLEQ
jgi:carboxylesterase type B